MNTIGIPPQGLYNWRSCGIDDRRADWDPQARAWVCVKCGAHWTEANGADYAPPKENDN